MPIAAVAAVAAAGVTAASAAGAFTPSASQPNYGQITADQLNAEIQTLPASYAAQSQYNPQFAALNSTIAWNNLFGTPATTTTTNQQMPSGWYDASGNLVSTNQNAFNAGNSGQREGYGLQQQNIPAGYTWKDAWSKPTTVASPGSPGELATMEAAAPALSQLTASTNTAARTADIADVANLGPASYAAIRGYDPAVTGTLDTLNQQAQQQLALNGALDPFTQRALQQNIRTSQAARGMGTGVNDAAAESYYLTSTQEARRAQNQTLASGVASQTAAYYGDPFQQVLSRTSGQTSGTPSVSYTANQPSAIPSTSNLTGLAGQGYTASTNASVAGQQQQASALQGLLSPSSANTLSSSLTSLYNYLNPTTGTTP